MRFGVFRCVSVRFGVFGEGGLRAWAQLGVDLLSCLNGVPHCNRSALPFLRGRPVFLKVGDDDFPDERWANLLAAYAREACANELIKGRMSVPREGAWLKEQKW